MEILTNKAEICKCTTYLDRPTYIEKIENALPNLVQKSCVFNKKYFRSEIFMICAYFYIPIWKVRPRNYEDRKHQL